jgi:hypothetical protein
MNAEPKFKEMWTGVTLELTLEESAELYELLTVGTFSRYASKVMDDIVDALLEMRKELFDPLDGDERHKSLADKLREKAKNLKANNESLRKMDNPPRKPFQYACDEK